MTAPFNVLDLRQNIFGNFLLEASAGTGKTFTISYLVLRIILESKEPVSILNIGVATFTKAAAAELKTRIKNLIKETKSKIDSEVEVCLFGCEKKEALKRLKLALCEIDQAPISTLHGLCFKILKKNALKFNLPLGLEDPQDQPIENLAFDFIKSFIQSPESDRLLCKNQKAILLSSMRGDLGQLITSIRSKVLSACAIERCKTWNENKSELEEVISRLPSYPGDHNLLAHGFRYKLSPITSEEFQNQIITFSGVISKKLPIENLLIKKPFLSFLTPERLKVKQSTKECRITADYCEILKTKLLPLIDQACDPSILELILANKIKELFEEYLEKTHRLSFQSMISILDQKLKEKSDIELINKQFQFMIIDEFQDTDPLQLNILKKLFIDHPVKAFYMVGDPKQAIYAFRSADVYSYLEAKKTTPNLNIYSLDTCYRSSSSFIQGLNIFFSKGSWIELPHLEEALDYQIVKYAKHNFIPIQECFYFYHLNENEENTEKELASLAARLCSKYPNDTIAILVKDRFQLDRMENHLKILSIQPHSIKNETLDCSYVYELMCAFLSLLDDPIGLSSLHKWLFSSWFNLKVDFFEKSTFENKTSSFFTKVTKIKETFNDCGLIAALEKCLSYHFLDERSLRASLCGLYGSDIDHKLFDVANLIINSDNKQSTKLLKIALEEQKKSSLKLAQIQTHNSQITLITSHMSKGLEYDHVIALGTSTRHEKANSILVKRINNKLTLGPDCQDTISEKAHHDLDAEKLRQLYVALTRAKKTVHIPIISYDQKEKKLGSLSPLEYYLHKICFRSKSYKEIYLTSCEHDVGRYLKNTFSEDFFIHLSQIDSSQKIQSESRVYFLDKTKQALEIKIEKSLSFSSLKTESINYRIEDPLKGKDYGDFFHFLMESMIKMSFYRNIDSELSQKFLKNLIKLSSFKEHEETIISHVRNAFSLRFNYDDLSFSLSEKALCDLFVEEAFCYSTDAGLMKGFIDLVIIHNDYVFFIDWKTSLLSDISHDGLEKHMKQASYDLQLKIYFEALQRLKPYFLNKTLAKAFYVFIKQNAIFESEAPRSLNA